MLTCIFYIRSSRKRHRSESRESYSSSDSSSEDERRHKKRKKDKKHKKSKKKSKKEKKSKHSVGDSWGKYGIIHEDDIFTKEPEFQAWLIQVKHQDVETLSKMRRKQMFLDFMEDYNTATMPHEKFYDMAKWERNHDATVRKGDPVPEAEWGTFDFRKDEENIKMERRRAAVEATKTPSVQLSQQQLDELSRVNRERVELDRLRRMGIKSHRNLGVRYDEA
ncbi:hypothetical protein DM01DRAFT_1306160 [Hesseltinella vesiculosa]|uniref:Uncharacterized protein n=1 Tax=Hesseltinella vesiculosa TaxID=101127 RepID=A0A1X2GGI0_9FUNG|nr:hypothetical protein DM01DRAFT_1306160 [Hesseltinella vesiculosa]